MRRDVDFEKLVMLGNLNVGDKVKLTDGSIAEFIKLKQKNFEGTIDGKLFNIPVNMAVEVVGKVDMSAKVDEISSLEKGEAFYISQKGKALLFIFEKHENGKIIGINPVSKASTKIDTSLYAGKVDDL